MKKRLMKLIVTFLAMTMMLMLFSACGSKEEATPATDAVVEETPATEATEAESTEASAQEETEKTVVSVEVYEDCDGSGHGVKIITYSDGTQEEEAF